jgi:hypothetical protein
MPVDLLDMLDDGIDLTGEEAEAFEKALAECRSDGRAEIEREVRARVAEEIEAIGTATARGHALVVRRHTIEQAAKIARGDSDVR